MAIDRRIGTKVDKSLRREDAQAIRVDPFPYIGIVKNNLDPTRCGRLQVWIPETGGDPDSPQNWRTVSYASPFMGTTNLKTSTATRSPKNSFDQTPHTYGMWMVPPDIGVEVIVLFIAGDPLKGYWLACVNSAINRHMLPGLASSTHIDSSSASADVKKAITPGFQYPVSEFNINDPNVDRTRFATQSKPIHEEQFRRLVVQGLDRDNTRGTITSSSQRESPSNVFGISTPGRPYKNDPADSPAFAAKLAAGTLTEDDYAVTTRRGGHTFVMDDGSVAGVDQLVRLRTANGHQIIMHDSDNTMYIANAEGKVWLELGPEGRLDIFAAGGFNLRTQGSINMHADKNITINAGGKFSVRAENAMQFDAAKFNVLTGGGGINLQTTGKFDVKTGGNFNVDTAGQISLKAGSKIIEDAGSLSMLTDKGVDVTALKMIPLNSHPDTLADPNTGLYKNIAGKISSIVSIAPGHEPFYMRNQSPPGEPETAKIMPRQSYSGNNDATKDGGSGVTNQVTDADIRNAKLATDTIGTLTKEETTALLAQLAKSESGGFDPKKFPDQYHVINGLGFAGKYQFGTGALQDIGYIKKGYSPNDNSVLTNPNAWTGKGGIHNIQEYYKAQDTQETMALEYQQLSYTRLVSNGVLTKDDTPGEVGGIMQVAWFGVGNAQKWRAKEIPDNYQGNPYREYYNRGKYAVTQMAPKVAEIQAG
jgi:hypothetical protein